MYAILYDFLAEHIFNSQALEAYHAEVLGVQTDMNAWLIHTTCIGLMVLAVVLMCLLVRWIWRAVSSAFLLR